MESNEFNKTTPKKGGNKRIWLIIVLLVILSGIIFLIFFNKDNDNNDEIAPKTANNSDSGPKLVEETEEIVVEETEDNTDSPKVGDSIKKDDDALVVSSIKVEENVIAEPKDQLKGEKLSEKEIEPGIFKAPSEEISALFKNAQKIDIGYNLNDYNFELLDATDTHLLFLANPRVLILYDIQLKKIYEISNNTDGGSFSDDGKYVVYYRNGFFSSFGEIYDIANKKTSIVKEVKDTTISDVKMAKGYAYFVYLDDDEQFKNNLTTYAYLQGNYEITETTTDDLYGVSPYLYQSSDHNIYFYNVSHNNITQFSANSIFENYLDAPNLMGDEVYIVENNTVFSSQLGTLYINNDPTDYTDIKGMTYVNNKLYFLNGNFLYTWDGQQYEEVKTFQFIQTIKSGNSSLYFRTDDGELFRMQTN